MTGRLLTLFFIFHTAWGSLLAQTTGIPLIKNYSYKNYKASLSNWDVLLGTDGRLYFANLDGILTFDSKNWNLIDGIQGTVSIARDANNRLYFGTVSDFGYLSADSAGRLKPYSLPHEPNIGPIWGITPCGSNIYFFSKKMIFRWDGAELKTFDADSSSFNYNLICDREEIYLLRENQGLVKIVGDSLIVQRGTTKLSNDNLIFLETKNDQLLIGTRSAEFFYYKSGKLRLTDNLDTLDQPFIFNIEQMNRTDGIAISTLNRGLIVRNYKNIQNSSVFDQTTGLQSNSVKNVFIEENDNIWTAMQEGISYIEYGSPWWQYNISDIKGTIISLASLNAKMYIGTTEGLYSSQENGFTSVNLVNSKTWTLKLKSENDKRIIACTSNGLYELDTSQIHKLSSIPIVFDFLSFKGLNAILHAKGISVTDNKMNVIRNIELGENTFIDIEVDEQGNIWAASKFKGIYKITAIGSPPQKIQIFNEGNGLPDVAESQIIKVKDQLLFATSQGLYEYNEAGPDSLKFIPHNGLFNPRSHVRKVALDDFGNFYYAIKKETTDRLEKYELQRDGTFKRIYKPFLRLPDMEINVIYPDKDSVLWVGGSEGLFRYDGKVKKDYDLPFNTLITKVTSNDSLIFGGYYSEFTEDNKVPNLTSQQPDETVPFLGFSNNDMIFEFAAAFYELPEKNQFNFYLKNNDDNWSGWTENTRKEYTNLAAGDYTFFVKSKNIYDTEGRTAAFSFTILPPWYQTAWAYVLFSVLFILLIWFVALAYSYRVRLQRRQLKIVVADRTFEVMNQKKVIEVRNDQLKKQNDEISQNRDEITRKNRKLETFQEEILTINNKLKDLNHSLEIKVEERTVRIEATLQELQKINKELDTFVYRASHDLKGPISRIHGLTSLGKLESNGDSKYYDLIELTALDMRGLLSKLSNTHEIMHKEVVNEEIDIPFLLSEIRNTVKFLDQDTKYHFDIQGEFTIYSDRYFLKIILENLIENALIFRKGPPDQHEVSIKCYEEGNFFFFQIWDNGNGIHPRHSEEIYDMFFRGSDQSKGSGLGLYLVKLALSKIEGEISHNSSRLANTRFTVKIPI